MINYFIKCPQCGKRNPQLYGGEAGQVSVSKSGFVITWNVEYKKCRYCGREWDVRGEAGWF